MNVARSLSTTSSPPLKASERIVVAGPIDKLRLPYLMSGVPLGRLSAKTYIRCWNHARLRAGIDAARRELQKAGQP
jgi:hypothetical protein